MASLHNPHHPRIPDMTFAQLDAAEQQVKEMFDSRMIDGRMAAAWQAEIALARAKLERAQSWWTRMKRGWKRFWENGYLSGE